MRQTLLVCLIGLLLTGCGTSGAGESKAKADAAVKALDGAVSSSGGAPQEIRGSGADGIVLHRDVVRQNAKSGDYITVFKGEKLAAPMVLGQDDIDYSRRQYKNINEELRSEKPGSVRSLLDEIVSEAGAGKTAIPGKETAPEETDFNAIRGRVVEFISDIRERRQTILVVTRKEHRDYFDRRYKNPPWGIKDIVNVPPDLASFTLVKKVNTDRNEIFSFSEDVDATKKMLRTIETIKMNVPEGFVYIKGGTFLMGSPVYEEQREGKEERHQVTVGSFYMSKYEVTQAEYEAVMGANPGDFKGAKLPVENVRWYEAIEYCNALSNRHGLTPAYTISARGDSITWNQKANGYRLPAEAEWEYACRAGTATPFNTGRDITTKQANYAGKKTMPVGSFAPNASGLYDMHGNVWEWCWDWYGDYQAAAQTGPTGPASGSQRVIRGGAWDSEGKALRSAYRNSRVPANADRRLGFRLARNAP